MSNTYQSIYVVSYRWIFKNFGQGKLTQFKSMFNVSFLLIISLTAALLFTQFALRSGLFVINAYSVMAIMAGAVFFIFLNHLIFLNNKWLKRVNQRMAVLSRHNLNTWLIVVLVNIIIICTFLLFTTQ